MSFLTSDSLPGALPPQATALCIALQCARRLARLRQAHFSGLVAPSKIEMPCGFLLAGAPPFAYQSFFSPFRKSSCKERRYTLYIPCELGLQAACVPSSQGKPNGYSTET